MLESDLEVGPFTPQELDEVCTQLKAKNIRFELLKDESTEKLETRSDYANLVNKAEFRTETYLAQIFYIKLSQSDFQKNETLFAQYGMATAPTENPKELHADMTGIHEASENHNRVKHWVAGLCALVLILFVIWNLKELFHL